MELLRSDDTVEFRGDARIAGVYHQSDPLKPYIAPLMTPGGLNCTLVKAHDHRHHKGLMYGLRSEDMNFWEEVGTLPEEPPGTGPDRANRATPWLG